MCGVRNDQALVDHEGIYAVSHDNMIARYRILEQREITRNRKRSRRYVNVPAGQGKKWGEGGFNFGRTLSDRAGQYENGVFCVIARQKFGVASLDCR